MFMMSGKCDNYFLQNLNSIIEEVGIANESIVKGVKCTRCGTKKDGKHMLQMLNMPQVMFIQSCTSAKPVNYLPTKYGKCGDVSSIFTKTYITTLVYKYKRCGFYYVRNEDIRLLEINGTDYEDLIYYIIIDD
jgi:hypothetical protein